VDISIIEFIVFGFIAYFSLACLISTTVKDNIPTTRLLAGLRSIYLIPGVISAGFLAYSGTNITGFSQTINTLGYNGTKLILNQTQTLQPQTITLLNPVWQTMHFAIMIIMIIFILQQLLITSGNDP
jgi:hypothetical protein